MKREIPLAITFAAGIIYAIAYYFALPAAVAVKTTLDNWFIIVGAVGCLIGVINLTRVHSRNISLKRARWWRSALLLAAIYITMAIGIIGGHQGEGLSYIYTNFIVPLDGSMYAILVFYIGSASYRAFRARNFEATLLLISGVIVMLGQAPIGAAISGYIPKASGWILDIPNAAGMRGIILGASIGAVSQAFRILVGIERTHLGLDL
ncbi:MAG: hypothetical protein ACM3WU_03295 [Bacillota bacterium]